MLLSMPQIKRFSVRVRALTLLLSVIMISLSLVFSASISVNAENGKLDGYSIRSNVNQNPMYVAIGLRYGSDVLFSVPILSPYGFVLGEGMITKTERSFEPLYRINLANAYAVCDTNIQLDYKSAKPALSEETTDIGGYHVELTTDTGNIWDKLDELKALLESDYIYCFPAFIGGSRRIRVGAYSSYADVGEAIAVLSEKLSDYNIGVAAPSLTGVCVLDEDMEDILFEYEGDDKYYLGFAAYQKENTDRAYLQDVNSSNIYDGVFCFRRYISSQADGLTFINLVELNTYVEGVIPKEIYTTWDLEMQKSFAITVRSYSLICAGGKHFSAYGFDMCSKSDCQNYGGRYGINARVLAAVRETKDLVLTFDNSIVEGLYSACVGGWTVDAKYVWGGASKEYLASQATPWEKYSEYRSGIFFDEVSGKELAESCRTNGKTNIKSDIVKIETTYAGESPYVYSMKLYDTNGNTATFSSCSSVRTLLHNVTYSANLVIGKGKVEYSYEDVKSIKVISLSGVTAGSVNVLTDKGETFSDSLFFTFFTGMGNAIKNLSSTLHVLTSKGIAQVSGSDIDIPVTTEPDENGDYTIVSNYGDFLIVTQLKKVYKTYTASDPSSFAIVSKGMGHGVGMSQYGACDLSESGATGEQILRAYYPGSEVKLFYLLH